MTNERFKELYETNRHNTIVMLYNYFLEEGGSPVDLPNFSSNFSIWCMMSNFGDVNGAILQILQHLKDKHEAN